MDEEDGRDKMGGVDWGLSLAIYDDIDHHCGFRIHTARSTHESIYTGMRPNLVSTLSQHVSKQLSYYGRHKPSSQAKGRSPLA